MLIEQTTERKRGIFNRWVLIAGTAVLIVCASVFLIVAINWPFTRQDLIDTLQERSARTVEIRSFRRTYFPPGAVAEGIDFLHRKHKNKPPLIQVQKLIIKTSYWGLFLPPKKIDEVHVIGMRMTVPPRGPDGQRRDVIPLTAGPSGENVTIGTITADGALLEFLPGQPGKAPYRLIIDRLRLDRVGNNRPISFRATLFNTEPPGEIHSSGQFGPWNEDDPGRTPVSGSYTYENVNLGVFAGISGTLSSIGKFNGVLDHIEAAGQTDVRGFRVETSSREVHLTAEFKAVINGTDGDTFLQPVIAHFLRTTVDAKGAVTGEEGKKGKTTALDLFVDDGRIDDLLRLLTTDQRPPMTGHVRLHARATVPPGPRRFLEKLQLDGDFGIGSGKFANPDLQGSINRLSKSAQRETRDQENEDPQTVLSDLKGHASVHDGIATLSRISFNVPGASAELHGTYHLITHNVDLHGTLRTSGSISDTTSGFKSLLLKLITPFLKKKSSMKIVPFKITGTYEKPSVALELTGKR